MYIYIYLCMYSSVLQQWQLICFLDAKPAHDETPKNKHFFHKNKNIKKTPCIKTQDQTNKMLNQKLYKQWLNI